MKLVGVDQQTGSVSSSSTHLQQLRVKAHEERSVQVEHPQTLGSRLDMALHMLLHGKRLQDMLFASHTIEVCTRYSRECCHKCVQLQISSTIFAAIRGLNRSRPHVELLHQLLLVLRNLTVYRRSSDKSKLKRVVADNDAKDRLDVDLRALDTLVDLLHIHRDMHHVFTLSADVITYYFGLLKPLADRNPNVRDSWSEAEKRLGGLQELLSRKLALYNATASFRRVNQIPEKSDGNNLMRKMNPKTAVSIMEKLVVQLKRQCLSCDCCRLYTTTSIFLVSFLISPRLHTMDMTWVFLEPWRLVLDEFLMDENKPRGIVWEVEVYLECPGHSERPWKMHQLPMKFYMDGENRQDPEKLQRLQEAMELFTILAFVNNDAFAELLPINLFFYTFVSPYDQRKFYPEWDKILKTIPVTTTSFSFTVNTAMFFIAML
ncbi:unnamed protein product [Phytophthora fragariaefolia]|uniref:Unnamed protein product n=1 Tax=Phytophthora fragariaefolia TaxID=1490495 RepID=A0A9W6XHY9_9STRA|nr:unnamed protein product [Phytophthora fragariaefolia]